MNTVLYSTAVIACLVAVSGRSSAQTSQANPNVPAVTGDRQAVPKPSGGPGASNTRGSATGMVSLEQRPKLREYALKQRDKEMKLAGDIRVGYTLPADAMLMDIPPEFNLARYRLALANQKTLLVDPATRRVEEVIE